MLQTAKGLCILLDRASDCELPKTSTGKVQKYVLREQEWAGYEARIAPVSLMW